MDVIQQLVSMRQRTVVDVGCGDMGFTAQLAEYAARVVAVDPDPTQAQVNRKHGLKNVEFHKSEGQSIPLPDGAADGVFFAYSLHHIPASVYERVFAEVRRVLQPHGFLYVIEPMDCPLNQVMKLFHDEDQERQAAQQALHSLAVPAFVKVEEVTYYSYAEYASFEQFAEHFSSRSFNSTYREEDVRRERVREAFENLGGATHRFLSPKRVMCLQELRPPDTGLPGNPLVWQA